MNESELKQVVAKIQLGDSRQVDALVLREWNDNIGMLHFGDAIEAVSMHRRESVDYLQAAHIHRNVARIVAARVEAARSAPIEEFAGDPKPTNWDAMCRAYKDPVAFAREVGIYDQQLVAAGLEPTSRPSERRWVA